MPNLPNWKYIIIHHSWSFDHDTLDWSGIRKYHTSYRIDGEIVSPSVFNDRLKRKDGKKFEKPWVDIGYHFGIEKVNGKYEVIVGRPLTLCGAHCLEDEMNSKAIGFCFIGKYDDEPPDEFAVKIAIKRIIVPMVLAFKIPVENIKGHTDYAKYKSCPGKKFDMEDFRKKVRSFL